MKNKMNSKNKIKVNKYSKGITLISLVITIVIMLVLAGVAINMIVGQNGLFNKTTSSKEQYSEKAVKEELDNALASLYVNGENDVTNEYIHTNLSNELDAKDTFYWFDETSSDNLEFSYKTYDFVIENEKVEFVGKSDAGRTKVYNVTLSSEEANVDELDVTFKVATENDVTVTNAKIQDNDIAVTSNEDGTYTFTVDKNGTYIVVVTDSKGNQIKKGITITNVSEIKRHGAYSSAKGVNTPNVSDGMIPVKWNGTTWVITTDIDDDWYNYTATDKKWANVMLSDGTYKKNTDGTITNSKTSTVLSDDDINNGNVTVAEADLGSMYVWIPRYAYQIQTNFHTNSSSAGIINIKFLKGIKPCTSINYDNQDITLVNALGQGNWNEHPAFKYGNQTIAGFWVAKFQTSASKKTLPNKTMDVTTLANCFNYGLGLNNAGNIFGLNQDDTVEDPHLFKNMEWGAVAYLAQSTYGKNAQVYPNCDKHQLTGRSGGSIEPNYYYTTTSSYETSTGVTASTSGNQTGVYDMAGGQWEYVSGYFDLSGVSDTTLKNAEKKYVDVYLSDYRVMPKSRDTQIATYGDALYETSVYNIGNMQYNAWYGDTTGIYPQTTNNLIYMYRGNHYSNSHRGIFCLNNGNSNEAGYRFSIVVY